MNCPYCKNEVPEPINNRFTCSKCLRPIIFNENIKKVKLNKDGIYPLHWLILLAAVVLTVPLTIIGYLSKSNFLYPKINDIALLILGAVVVHDGFLSLQSKIDNKWRRVLLDQEAVKNGRMKIVVGLLLILAVAYSFI